MRERLNKKNFGGDAEVEDLYSSRDQLEVSDLSLAADRSKTRVERTSILSREEYTSTPNEAVLLE